MKRLFLLAVMMLSMAALGFAQGKTMTCHGNVID